MKAILVPVCLFPILLGCGGADQVLPSEVADASAESVDARGIALDYTNFQAMTKEPVLVSPELATLCIPATQNYVEHERMRSGPHAHTAIRVYMNDRAADTFRKTAKEYPVGSIVVKEKSAGGHMSELQSPENSGAQDGVGGMIKRPAGYDPEHGDWEYFYFRDASEIESGRIESCVNCHAGAAATDRVFGSWADGD